MQRGPHNALEMIDMPDDAPPQRNIAAVVFQGNPRLYDIDAYLARQTFVYWNCPRHSDQLMIGMPAFIKRSGQGGGIVASGSIAELPKPADRLERPEFLGTDLWHGPPETDPVEAGIQLDDVRLTAEEGMISTQILERLTELAGHPLVTVRRGSVFRLSEGQAMGVFRAWGGSPQLVESSDGGAEEGCRRTVIHRRIERQGRLVQDKKQAFRAEHGRLECEVCGFDHASLYPTDWVERIFEVHHLRPLSELDGPCRTRLEDLMIVCGNCHALIHRTSDAAENLRQLQQHFGVS